jgi:hypothetical protein
MYKYYIFIMLLHIFYIYEEKKYVKMFAILILIK